MRGGAVSEADSQLVLGLGGAVASLSADACPRCEEAFRALWHRRPIVPRLDWLAAALDTLAELHPSPRISSISSSTDWQWRTEKPFGGANRICIGLDITAGISLAKAPRISGATNSVVRSTSRRRLARPLTPIQKAILHQVRDPLAIHQVTDRADIVTKDARRNAGLQADSYSCGNSSAPYRELHNAYSVCSIRQKCPSVRPGNARNSSIHSSLIESRWMMPKPLLTRANSSNPSRACTASASTV